MPYTVIAEDKKLSWQERLWEHIATRSIDGTYIRRMGHLFSLGFLREVNERSASGMFLTGSLALITYIISSRLHKYFWRNQIENRGCEVAELVISNPKNLRQLVTELAEKKDYTTLNYVFAGPAAVINRRINGANLENDLLTAEEEE